MADDLTPDDFALLSDPKFLKYAAEQMGFQQPEPAQPRNRGLIADYGTDLKIGIQNLPGIAAGLADIPVAGITGRAYVSELADRAGEATGFQPSKWAKEAQSEYSPERQRVRQEIDNAWENGDGWDVAKAYFSNPGHAIGGTIVESAPAAIAGGLIGRGLMAAGSRLGAGGMGPATQGYMSRAFGSNANKVASAIGEGSVIAGSANEQMLEAGVDPQRAAAFALPAGVIGGALGYGGAALANRMGLGDIDTMITGGATTAAATPKGIARRMAEGAVQEGFLEELPQSLLEQGLQNVAQGNAWTEGLARAGVEGTLAGAGMGAGANIMSRPAPFDQAEYIADRRRVYEALAQERRDADFNQRAAEAMGFNSIEEYDQWYAANLQPEGRKPNINQRLGMSPELPVPPGVGQPSDPISFNPAPVADPSVEGSLANNYPERDALGMPVNTNQTTTPISFNRNPVEDQQLDILGRPIRVTSANPVDLLNATNGGGAAYGGNTPVVEASGQAASGVTAGGPGNLGNQLVVGRGGSDLAGAPVVGGRANPVVGDASGGVGAVSAVTEKKPRSKGAINFELKLNQAIESGQLSPDHEIVKTWRSSDKIAAMAKELSNSLNDVLAGEQVAFKSPEQTLAEADQRAKIDNVFEGLDAREKRVLEAYYFDKLTDEAIGKELGVDRDKAPPSKEKQIEAVVRRAYGKAHKKNKAAQILADNLAARSDEEVLSLYSELGEGGGYTRSRIGQIRDEAIGKLKARAGEMGVPPERIDEYFANENNSLRGGADIQTATAGELAQSGAAMHTPGRVDRQVQEDTPVADRASELGGEIELVGQFQDSEDFDKEPGDVTANADDGGTYEMAEFEGGDLNWVDINGNPLSDQDVREAEEEYDAVAEKYNGKPFVDLSEDERLRITRLYAAYMDDTVSLQAFNSVLKGVANEYKRKAPEASGAQSVSGRSGQAEPVAEMGKAAGAAQQGKPVTAEAAGRGDTETEDGKVKFSLTTAADRLNTEVSRWSEVVDAYLAKSIDRTKPQQLLSSTPASLQAMGLPNLEVRTGVHMMDYANVRLTREQMIDLPRQLANPVMTYIHQGNNGLSFNLVTEFKNGEGQLVIALKPNQSQRAEGEAHFVATVVNVPQQRIIGEMRNGHGVYISSKDAWPGLREAVDFAQKQKGREASEVRAQMARTYNLASIAKRLLFKSDLVKLVTDGRAQFSTGISGATTVEGIRRKLKPLFFSGTRFDNKVVVVESADALPEDLRSTVDDTTQAFVQDGKAYLIAGNIAEGKELAVFLHEVGVHLGMKNLLGQQNYDKLVEQVKQWAENSDGQEGDLARASLRRVMQAEENLGEEYSAPDFDEELVAYFVEEAVKAGLNPTAISKTGGPLQQWFRTLWASVKAALRKFGLDRVDQLTAQNVVDLAYGAARLELEGTWHGTAADFRNFDHSYMGSGEGAQAFGWGTYLAQRPGIAKGYWKDDVRRKGGSGRPTIIDGAGKNIFTTNGPMGSAQNALIKANGDFAKARAGQTGFGSKPVLAKLEELEAIGAQVTVADSVEGSLMRVDTAVHDDEMLDWDKPLSEQSEKVKAALASDGQSFDTHATGADIYRSLQSDFGHGGEGSDQAASEYLDSIGIKGVKFLDSVSRNGPSVAGAQVQVDRWQREVDYFTAVSKVRELTPQQATRFADAKEYLEQAKQELFAAQNQTRNLVIFNDKNIQRVATQVGADRNRVKFSKLSPESAFSTASDVLNDSLTNTSGWMDKLKLGFSTLEQLVWATKSEGVKAFQAAMTKAQKTSQEIIYKASLLDQRWAKLSDADSKKLSNVMTSSTVAQFDPTLGKPETPEQQKILVAFNALPKDAQQLYKDVRDHYTALLEQRQAIMLNMAKKAKLHGKAVSDIDQMYANIKGPYFPLMRLGQYYAVGMSKRMTELDAKQRDGTLTPSEKAEYAELRKNPKHYVTSSHATEAEARRKAEQYKSMGGQSFINENEEKLAAAAQKFPGFAQLEAYLSENIDDKKVRAQVSDMFTKMIFDLAPEGSALKNLMKREGIAGFNEDMRQVFAKSALSQAHYISRLENHNDITAALFQVKQEGTRDLAMRRVGNELTMRMALSMEQEDNPLIDKITNLSYFAHLGASPAFLLVNMTQVPMITLPWLGARYGWRRSNAALAAAYKDAFGIIKTTLNGAEGWRSEIDWSSKFKKGSNEDRMLRELLDRNLLDITMEHDLGTVAELGGGRRSIGEMKKLLSTPTRITEYANRAITALAAYRLATQNGTSHDAAVDAAAKAVSQTQLNYSSLNTARHMQQVFGSKGLARMVMQFRKYQQGMLWLIASNIKDALPKGNLTAEQKETQRIARRTLLGLFATTGTMAGTLGLPLVSTVGMLASFAMGLGGDSDEPWDWEVELRNFYTDLFGKEVGLALSKGVPAAVLGMDLSKRVGLGEIATPLPFVRAGDTVQATAGNLVIGALGAPISMAITMADGLGQVASGEVSKGAEKIIPLKAAKDILKGMRYSDEGMTDRNGNVILAPEKFDPWDIALRSTGFSSTKETEYYDANNAMQGAKDAAEKTRKSLLAKYSQAKLAGEDTTAIDEDIKAFNERHPEKGVRIDHSAKLRSVQNRKKMAKERDESGVRTGDAYKPYADRARFATG